MINFGSMRYTNVEGHCVMALSSDGQTIYTGGGDGEVKRYLNFDDEEPESFLIGDEVLALGLSSDKFYCSSTNTCQISAYSFKGERLGVILRFQGDATCLDILDDRLLAGSEDMTLKLVRLSTGSLVNFSGHEAPILNVALGQETVASSSGDGSFKVWNASSGECIKTHSGIIPKTNDFVSSSSQGVVKFQNGFFSVSSQKGIRCYHHETGDFLKEYVEESQSQDEIFTTSDWSSDGSYLAAGTNKGRIIIWRTSDSVVLFKGKSEKSSGIWCLFWNPSDSSVINFLDSRAYWGRLLNISFTDPSSIKKNISDHKEEQINDDDIIGLFDDEEDEDENSFSLKKLKETAGFVENENGEMSFVSQLRKKEEESKNKNEVLEKPPEIIKSQPTAILPKINLQDPFQPSSTPSHLSSRFMVWNSVGIVKATDTEEENSIDIEFHDAGVHHPFHISNVEGYVHAGLSDKALVLATESEEEENDENPAKGSKLSVRYFASSDPRKEWSLDLPPGEEILSLTLGEDWIAVATDVRLLRLFSLGGMQKEILNLPGPVVSLAGSGSKCMIVVHSPSSPLPGEQSMLYAVFSPFSIQKPLKFEACLLAPKTTLTWIGFSDEGSPTMMDSSGRIRILCSRGWIQVCDTSLLSKHDKYFLVGLSETDDSIRCICCKGRSYPTTVPKPNVMTISLALPLCERGTDKTTLEEKYWKSVLFKSNDEDSDTNETLVKLFALACKADSDSRALETCSLMDYDTLTISIKYASKLRRIQLANKLGELARKLVEEEEESQANNHVQESFSQNDLFENNSTMGEFEEEQEEGATQINPLLAAKNKKKTPKSIAETQSQNGRNPFKKNTTPLASSSSETPRSSGLVFDTFTPNKPGNKTSSAFGVLRTQSEDKKTFKISKQPKINLNKQIKEKENDETLESSQPLKGFKLWVAESSYDQEDQASLKIWKSLSKEEKEDYKVPRLPKKRKRECSDEGPSKSKAKLSSFVAPE